MLYVLFQVGDERYALPAADVIEVLPLVESRPLPHAAAGVAGLFNYRGRAVPLLDLAAMMLGRPSLRRTTTRILIVPAVEQVAGLPRLLGVLAEKATGTTRIEDTDFRPSGVDISAAPYLGPVASDSRGIIQRLEIERIVTPEVREQLFRMADEESP